MIKAAIIFVFLVGISANIAYGASILLKNVQQQSCKADIVFLVDQSTSITHLAYTTYVVPFLKELTSLYNVGPDQTHVAMVQFSSPSETEVVFDFDFPQNEQAIDAKFDKDKGSGTTALVHALNLTYTRVYDEAHGARPTSQVSRIAVIITDGIATDTDNPASIPLVQKLITDKSLNIYTVGVGPALTPEYLIMLTGNKPDRVYDLDKFSTLDTMAEELATATGCASKH